MFSRTLLGLGTMFAAAALVKGQSGSSSSSSILSSPVAGVEVPVTCTSCSCEGTTEGGNSIIVFDDPSSGNQIVSVDGELSEISPQYFCFEGRCPCEWFFYVDDTLHYISGLEYLGSPEVEAIYMTDDDSTCDRDRMGASATADCYSGTPEEKEFGDGLTMDLTLCFCTETDGGSTSWQSYVGASVQGTCSFELQDSDICRDNGFTSMTVDVAVDGVPYSYNFDMVIPGEAGSAGLSVSPGPDSVGCPDADFYQIFY